MLVRRIKLTTGWYVYDNNQALNPNGKVVGLNNNFDEDDDATGIDFLSNGFKLRNTRAMWVPLQPAIYTWRGQKHQDLVCMGQHPTHIDN